MPTVASGHRPLICAHACTVDGGAPNTLAGLRTLVAEGVEMAEVDVRRSADGVLVAHHDERLPDGRLLRQTPSAEIHRAYPSRSQPARLEELLAAAPAGTRLMLDLKEDRIEQQALVLALEALPGEDLTITTLSPIQVARVKAVQPEVRVGLSLNRSPVRLLRGLARARASGADLLSIHHVYLRTWLPAGAAGAELPLFAWTVDDDARLARVLRDRRVTCVITGRPLRARELRETFG